MSFIEEEYLRKISWRLRNFKVKGNHAYVFSCPICGDSKKKLTKARGGAFDKNGSLLIGCFNCNHEFNTFPKFLAQIDPNLYQEFIMERFQNKLSKQISCSDEDLFKSISTKKYVPNIFSPLQELKYLDDKHPAKSYALSRKLPIDKFEFYYVDDFIEWTKGHTDKFEKVIGDVHPRIVLPFKARDGHYIGYTARSLNGEEPKYYRIFIDADEKERFFGIDKLNESKQVYVLEGEIDSLFIPNSIAVSNGKLDVYFNKNAIYIPDADKRNPHIVKGIGKLFDAGLRVCLFPDNMPGKDIGDFIKSGLTSDDIVAIINENTYQGLVGKMRFNAWRVV